MQITVPEVDFNMFLLNFWPTKAPRHRNIFDNLALPSLVWTQIYSIIKGSQYSYLYPGRALPLSLYKERVQSYLSENQIQEIYQYYFWYEEWKDIQQYYDQLDIVNNLLISFENQTINLYPIHYCYIDEVQDLPQALIELYCKVTEQGIIFCGDTAQSILKGVGFRFSDLQTQFKNSKQIGANEIEKFQIFQLTTNFRSHNNILQFANVLITILELLFPQSIDHLQKEISNLQGPKPIIIAESDPSCILHYLDQQSYGEQQCDIEFGYNQVILVKNEQEKNTLPEVLKNARVLTVGQAKGLEFDDVVIYNFFTTEPLTEQQWQFLTCIDVNERYVDHEIYDHSVTKHKQEQTEDINKQKQENMVKVYNLILNDKYQAKKIIDFSSLCNELKLLYVCVTRAKKRVIIYDDEPLRREYLEKILFKQNVCEGQFNNHYRNYELKKQFIHQIQPIIKSTPRQQVKESQIDENEQKKLLNDWNESGHAMFQRKLYDEAIKCFQKAQNDKMRILSEAYYQATKGAQQLAIYQQIYEQYQINKTLELKFQLDQVKEAFQNYFEIAAKQFLDGQINDQIKAADCYYSGQQYTDALILYLNQEIYQKANKCAKKLKLRYLQVVICLKVGDMVKCLKYLNKYKIDEFFKYDLLKHGFNFGLFDEKFIKEQLLLLSKETNNIFQQLLLKSLGENNDTKAKEQIAQSFCDRQLFEKLNLQTQFKNEIDQIYNSQIYIDNDLLEMIIVQISEFQEIYFQILDEKMIINPFNLQELKQCFYTKEYNQHFFDFIQEILEQFNLYELLVAVSTQIGYFYEKYQNSQVIQQQKFQQRRIQKHDNEQNNNQKIKFILNQKSSIQTFLIHEFIYCKKSQNLLEYFRNQKELKNDEICSNYWEINQLLIDKEIDKQENFIYIVKSYYIFVNIANKFKEQLRAYQFQAFEDELKQKFIKNKLSQFDIILEILEYLFCYESYQVDVSLFDKLFDEKFLLKYFEILFLLIYLYDDKNKIQKLFFNFTPDHYFKLFELLIIGQNLFLIEDKIECQKQIFYAICAIKGYQILTSQSCNFIGTNLIFKYSFNNQTFTHLESQQEIKEIQRLFQPIIEMVYEQFFVNSISKVFNGKSIWQQTFDHNLEYSEQLKYFLQTNLQLFLQKEFYKTKIGIFKIFQVSILFFKQIPQQLKEITSRNLQLENFKEYMQFKLVCQKQLSLKIIHDWIKYYQSLKAQQIQFKIFEEELQMVILFLLILYQQSLTQLDKITYEVRENFQPYDIIDSDKLKQLKSQNIIAPQSKNQNLDKREDKVQDKIEDQEQAEKKVTQEQYDILTDQQQQINNLEENKVIQYIEVQQSTQDNLKQEKSNQIQNNFEENNKKFKEVESEEKNMLNERNDELNREIQVLREETQYEQKQQIIEEQTLYQQQQLEEKKVFQEKISKVQDSEEQEKYQINEQDKEDIQDLENQENENYEDQIQRAVQEDDLNNQNEKYNQIDNFTEMNENKNMLKKEQDVKEIQLQINDSLSDQILNNRLLDEKITNISQINQQLNDEQNKQQNIEVKVSNIIGNEDNQQQIIVNDVNLQINNLQDQQEQCNAEQFQESQNKKFQVIPLILLNSQQQYLQNMEKSNICLISLQPEDQSKFSEIVLDLINYLLISIQKPDYLPYKIINDLKTNQFMELLFILIHNLQSQKQQDNDLVYQILQLFQKQKFQKNYDCVDLGSILEVLKFNDQTLIKKQENSVKHEASLKFVDFAMEETDTTQFYYDSKKYQQKYPKKVLDYLGIRNIFFEDAQLQDNQKHLIYQKIYNLKNKLIGYLSVYQPYSKFKEFSRTLATVSDIEQDLDKGKNSYSQQQSLDQIEAKLEDYFSQKISSEDNKKLQQ